MNEQPTADDVDVFFGRATTAQAHVYAKIRTGEEPPAKGTWNIVGQVRGPWCEGRATLQASSPFIEHREGLSPLAEAVVPEPCFWSPAAPFLYEATVNCRVEGHAAVEVRRVMGVRPLGPVGRELWWESRAWRFTALRTGGLKEAEEAEWLEIGGPLAVEHPSDAMCWEASRRGILLAAELYGEPELLAAELRRMSQWPAVFLAVVRSTVGGAFPTDALPLVRNLLVTSPGVSASHVESFDADEGSPGESTKPLVGLFGAIVPAAQAEQRRAELEAVLGEHPEWSGVVG